MLREHIGQHVARIDRDPLFPLSDPLHKTPSRHLKFFMLQRIMRVAAVCLRPDQSSARLHFPRYEGERPEDSSWSHFKAQLRLQILDCLVVGEQERSVEVASEELAEELIELFEADHGWDELDRWHERVFMKPELEVKKMSARLAELSEFL